MLLATYGQPHTCRHSRQSHSFPSKHEEANIRANEYAYDNITIVVHSEPRKTSVISLASKRPPKRHIQHNKVRHSKSRHVYQRPNSLLQHIRSERRRRRGRRTAGNECSAILAVVGGGAGRDRRGGRSGSEFLLVLVQDVAVVLLARATEELKCDDEEDDADAGPGENAVGGDAPAAGDEAWVGVACQWGVLWCRNMWV